MPNFNSREVAEKLSGILNMHDHVRPGSDRLAYAAAILDSALLAANLGAEELADFAFASGFNFGRQGFQTLGEVESERTSRRNEVTSKIVAALEAAKRKAVPRWISVEDRLPEVGGLVVVAEKYRLPYVASRDKRDGLFYESTIDGEMEVHPTYWFPLPSDDSLAEKEGGR